MPDSGFSTSIAAMVAALALTACSSAEGPASRQPATGAATVLAGWYMEHAGQGSFQPCGRSQPLLVTVAADLPARAKAFDLGEDTPVYVRVTASVEDGNVVVYEVIQFGSPVPVGKDCALQGVVIPAMP